MIRFTCLAITILLGLVIGQAVSPFDSFTSFVRVDEQYLATIRNHTLLVGSGVSLAACTVNLLLRISHRSVLLILILIAAVRFTWLQSAEPDYLSYLAGALVEYLALTLLGAAPVVGVFWLIERKRRDGHDEVRH